MCFRVVKLGNDASPLDHPLRDQGGESQVKLAPNSEEVRGGDSLRTRVIAFYLPQFHPIAENDMWWGRGFTEWTSVAKARPQFPGHYQPHIPADLGFYDLRLPEVREAQADLAREYGLHGFCYYHYWFNGRRLLDRPINEVLGTGTPDFPFCLCWANENWTRAWDGHNDHVLIGQKYSDEDDRNHIRWLVHVFGDKRYIRIAGKPLFLVYRASMLPNALRTTDVWRSEARKMGIGEIYLCKVESFRDEYGDPSRTGFDGAVEFQPKWHLLGAPLRRNMLWRLATKVGLSSKTYQYNHVYDYSSYVEKAMGESPTAYTRFPCVTPCWDNTPRRGKNSVILRDSTPERYGRWLQAVIDKFTPPSDEENLIFVNAWNEWGEGNHIEPCLKWGKGYLEATRRAIIREGPEWREK